jgi:hypothetical protein
MREPAAVWRLQGQALAYYTLRREKDAETAFCANSFAKYETTAAYEIAGGYANSGRTDQAFQRLYRPYAQRNAELAEIRVDSLRSLHGAGCVHRSGEGNRRCEPAATE